MPFAQDLLRPYARLATTNRLILYGAFSILAVSLVVLNAFKSYSNFYSVAVHLSRSNRSVMVLANFGILGALLVGRGFQHVLFGSLRATEVERLYDRIWFFLTESLLAFTIFRDEFDVNFAIMFGFLLFVKCFHWLMSFRIEWMDQIQYPGPNVWFHVRMNILFFFLWFIDTIMLCFAIESILTHGVGGVVLFASEYAILMASALNSICKYFIIFYDIRRAAARGGENAPIWEDKSMFIFYIELATDFLKLVTYLTFFLLVLTFYGLPLNIVRDVYMTARSFITRCRDLIRYRTATRNMDERYPNASEDELNQMNDRTCIICREEMLFRHPQPAAERAQTGINDTPKKLPCGHVFHFHCLRSWLERQQSCPTCRRTVLETRPPRQNPIGQDRPQPGQGPQPGVFPQLQGFPGAPAQQQPQAPGFLARWFGGPAAAPIVPGQFAHGPADFNPGAPLPQQGFPGQNPFGPWQQPGYYPPLQQGPAPVQVLQGFYIGNQWQPWGAPMQPPQQHRPRVGSQAQAPTAAPQPPADAPTSILTTPPTSTTPSATDENERMSASSTHASSWETAPSHSNGEPSTPRDAAALAALRRINSQNITPTARPLPTASFSDPSSNPRNEQGPVNDSNPAPRLPSTPTPTSTSDSSQNIPSISRDVNAGSQASSTSTELGPPSSILSRPRNPVPSLIPLFDPATTSATIVAPPPYNRMPSQSNYPPFSNTPPSTSHQQRPRPRPADVNPLVSELLRSTSTTNAPDLRSLPQTLTQEQLDRMDVVTRDAIDERLRALENVQGAVWRCVEELVRIRSVLPSRQNGPPTSRPSHDSDSGTSGIAEKGKAPVVSTEDAVKDDAEKNAESAASSSDSVVPAALDVGSQSLEHDTDALVTGVMEENVAPPQ
ncbi:hypothetical protein K439DRAFT_1629493 [Ramaria rubella]|nr:hypothetical protein K439DRAFT_1629493 [Ramaria rubella]